MGTLAGLKAGNTRWLWEKEGLRYVWQLIEAKVRLEPLGWHAFEWVVGAVVCYEGREVLVAFGRLLGLRGFYLQVCGCGALCGVCRG